VIFICKLKEIYTTLCRRKGIDRSNIFCLLTPLTFSHKISENNDPIIDRWQYNEPESNNTHSFRVSNTFPHEIFRMSSQK